MILYKYLPPERIDVLRDGLIRFTQAAALNDPLDCKVRYLKPDEISHGLIGENCCIQSYTVGIQDALLRNERISTGFLCLTEKPDNLLMWSHYARNHEGFLIGFDVQHEFFAKDDKATGLWKVKYTNKRPTFPKEIVQEELKRQPGINPYGVLNTILLGEHRFNPDTTKSDYRFIKSKEWEYEHEWRLIRQIKPPYFLAHDGPPFPVYLFPFPHTAVRSVIIGCRGVSNLYRQIEEIIENNEGYANVKILLASTKHEQFGLHIQRYDSKNSPLYHEGYQLIPADEEFIRPEKKHHATERVPSELNEELDDRIKFIVNAIENIKAKEAKEANVDIDVNKLNTLDECFNCFMSLAEEGRSKDAIAVIWRVVDLNPDRIEGIIDASGFLTRVGLLEQAASLLNIAIAEKPKLAYPHYCLGLVHAIQQKEWYAEAAFRTAIRLDPTLAEAWTNLGIIYQSQGRGCDAISHYQKALEHKPNLVEPSWNLGHIYVKNNMDDEFFEIFTQALTNNAWLLPQLAVFGASILGCISEDREHGIKIIQFFKKINDRKLLGAISDILKEDENVTYAVTLLED